MHEIHGNCLVCGTGISAAAGIPGAPEDGLIGICQNCSTQELLDEGGSSFDLIDQPKEAPFRPGRISVTAEAIRTLEKAGQQSWLFLERHMKGDWGDIGLLGLTELTDEERAGGYFATDDDAKLNKIAIERQQRRLLSSYRTAAGDRLWVLTELGNLAETVVMLPEEY